MKTNIPDIEFSTETVLEDLQDLEKADPTVFSTFLSELGMKALNLGLQLILAAVIFLVGTRIIKLVQKILRKALDKRDADPEVKQFLDSFVKFACYVMLVFVILALFGVTTASIIAVIGSAGFTIGMALQGSLSNFAGGVLILLLRPFRVGDYILEDKQKNEGTITEISIFYTKLLTIDNKIVVIPNGDISATSIVNYTRMERRRVIATVGISYEADLRKAKSVLEEVIENEPARIENEPVDIYVDSLAISAVNLGYRVWVPTARYWEARWRLAEDIKIAFDAAGIEIPHQKVDVAITKPEPQVGENILKERA